MGGYTYRNLGKNRLKAGNSVFSIKKMFFMLSAVMILTSMVLAQVEFRDENPFQFYNDISIEEGEIKMNQNRIVGLPEPESDSEPITQAEIGEDVVDRDGDSMRGNLDMQNNQIIGDSGQIDFEAGQVSEIGDISGLKFIVPNEELQITEDVEISGELEAEEGIRSGGHIESHTGAEGIDQHYYNKELRTMGTEGVIILTNFGADGESRDHVQGTIYGERSTGRRDGRVINIHYSSSRESSGGSDDRYTASLDYSTNPTRTIRYELVSVDYEGNDWLALYYEHSSSLSGRDWFTGFLDSDDQDMAFTHIRSNDDSEWDDIKDTVEVVDYESYFSKKTSDGLGINVDRPDEMLHVDGNIKAGENNIISGGTGADSLVESRNFGSTNTGASHYLVGQSENRAARWRDNLFVVYDSLQVGDGYGTNSPDHTLEIHGDSRFRDDINLDGNDMQNVREISGQEGVLTVDGDLEVTGTVNSDLSESPDCLAHSYSDGESTESDPYVIYDVHDLQCANAGTSDHYKLGSDVDASYTREWNNGEGFEPIGGVFEGTFDGRGHEVRGLYIDRPNDYYRGLFAQVGGEAEIRDLGIADSFVYGGRRNALLAGRTRGNSLVERVWVSGEVRADRAGGGNWAQTGGLVGYAYDNAVIRESVSYADVIGDDSVEDCGRAYGSAIGFMRGQAEAHNIHAHGNVIDQCEASTFGNPGSLVGEMYNEDPVVTNSFSTGYAEGNGLIGSGTSGAEVNNSYWDSETTETTSSAEDPTPLTTNEMTGTDAENNMNGFNFNAAGEWRIGSMTPITYRYPQLRNIERQGGLR